VTLTLLVDLSESAFDPVLLSDAVDVLADSDGLGAITSRAFCILPPGARPAEVTKMVNWQFFPAEDATAFSSCALAAASRARQPLLVIRGQVLAGNEPIGKLLEVLDADPMFGFAIARVANEDGQIAKIRGDLGDPEMVWFSRALLGTLPEYYIVPEVVGTCFLVRPEVVANFGGLASGFKTTRGAWLHYFCRARRTGFRGVIVNHAVVTAAGSAAVSALVPDDYWKLHRQYPDVAYANQEFCRLPAHEYEALVARAVSTEDSQRKTLLIDARGMPPYYNGTTTCTLGLLDGLATAALDWNVSVLVKPESSAFHQLAGRYPNWAIFDSIPARRFTMVLRLSQPWDVQTLIEIHSLALFSFVLMLDTISWDIIYNGTIPAVLDTTWRFLAEFADGIMYISDFSHQRFISRFPPDPMVRHYVSYLPFHQDDYGPPHSDPASDGGYLLVIGNHLDHKWVRQTVEVLAPAFPFESVHALGCEDPHLPNVRTYPSGQMCAEEIEQMFAGARIIVFPSFYEGFGLPIPQGLRFGKPVVARASALLDEIAARCRMNGALHPFSDPMELMEIISRLLRGEEVASLPLGSALKEGEEPMRWVDIARNMLHFMEPAIRTPGNRQWLRRMHCIQMLQGWRL
jgi:hypothetical protein